jgi:hypothetical protein
MDRKYSDKEMRAILDKAISLQAGQQGTYSKQQIEQIGEELGLSGDLIERAAREIDIPAPPAPAKPRRVRFIGAPAERDQVMRVERILSDEEVELLVDTFCSVTGAKGKLRKYGKHWAGTHPGRATRCSGGATPSPSGITNRTARSRSSDSTGARRRTFRRHRGRSHRRFRPGVRDSGGHSHRLSAHRRCGAFGNLPVFLRACIYHIQWRVIRLG